MRPRIIIVLLATGLACLGAGGLIGYQAADQALGRAVEQRLMAQRESKRSRIEAYISNELRFTSAVGGAPETVEATRAFIGAIGAMRAQPADPAADRSNVAALEAWYRDQFIPRLDRVTGGHQPVEALIPSDPVTRQLQADYIVRNPNPVGEKYKLAEAPGQTPYDVAHARFHPALLRLSEIVGFFDINIMDAETGDVIYGRAKEPDFASNMYHGTFAQSGFARAARRALDPVNGGAAVIEDYTPYEPSAFAPELLTAVPIVFDGRAIGVFVAQINVKVLNGFLTDGGRWRETGEGETGEVVLIGEDRLYRSEPRALVEQPAAFFAALLANGLPESTVNQMKVLNTAILYLPVKLEAIERAFHNQTGFARYVGVRDQPIIAAYGPIEVAGLRWAIAAKQDVAEAFAPTYSLRNRLLTAAMFATIVLTFVALACAAAFTRPLRRILAGMESVRNGGAVRRVPVQGGGEFAELGRGYNAMADAVESRDKRLAEAEEARAVALRGLYPEGIAERLRTGATVTAETVANVTVAIAWIDGLDRPDDYERDVAEVHERLNTMLGMLNRTAVQHGIEPVRALGESYIAVCGLSSSYLDHASRALAWTEAATLALAQAPEPWARRVTLRFGLASGDIDVLLLSSGHSPYDIWGFTLAVARLVAVETPPGTVRVTESTYRLLSDLDGFAPCPAVESASFGRVASWVRPLGAPALVRAAQ